MILLEAMEDGAIALVRFHLRLKSDTNLCFDLKLSLP